MAPSNVIRAPQSGSQVTEEKFDLFQYAETLGFGDLHFRIHSPTQLRALIAIHSTRLGPAFGGCRCVSYTSIEAALQDAMRLARGMSYKNALARLPHGGGKAVLIRPPSINDRKAYFEAFGCFINDLGGRYITAVDSGTSVVDMDFVAERTAHVLCTSKHRGGSDDPSPYTAFGVRLAFKRQ
jgi:leucine dehydrogenase